MEGITKRELENRLEVSEYQIKNIKDELVYKLLVDTQKIKNSTAHKLTKNGEYILKKYILKIDN